tara:strand:+ start:144 stop:1073 length:930 start_codon:yes stop_codon:yes gene_type:complete
MKINKFFIIFNNLYFDLNTEINLLLEKNFKLEKNDINIILNRNKNKKINLLSQSYNVPLNCFNFFIHFISEGYCYEKHIIFNKGPSILTLKATNPDNKLIRINIINLEKASERLLNMKKQLNFFNQFYKIFTATDPLDQNFINLLNKNSIKLNRGRKRYGEAGCALSHISIIKQFLESNEKYCIILEDDCQIVKRIPQRIIDYVKIFNETTDILYISNRVKCNKKGEIISGVGTEGYIIDRKGATKILDICQNIDCGIDLRYQSHFPFYYRKNHQKHGCNTILYGKKSSQNYVLHRDNGISYIENTYNL